MVKQLKQIVLGSEIQEAESKTCGDCIHGVPCNQLHKHQGIEHMTGWLSCTLRQSTPEEQARYMSPRRTACPLFTQKQEAA